MLSYLSYISDWLYPKQEQNSVAANSDEIKIDSFKTLTITIPAKEPDSPDTPNFPPAEIVTTPIILMEKEDEVKKEELKHEIKEEKEEIKEKSQNKISHIVLLVDESGSMGNNRAEIINAINFFITDQQKIQDSCKLSLICFDHKYKIINDSVCINEAKQLDFSLYQPFGCTALYDAIGITINKLKNDHNVLFIIITDGWENSSREYTKKNIAELINEHKDKTKGNWKFLYLASEQFLLKQSIELNITNDKENNSYNAAFDFVNIEKFFKDNIIPFVNELRNN
jgi:Mg-chelatase subunit ChlD